MKSLLLTLLSLALFISCKKSNLLDESAFINQVIDGTYNEFHLPDLETTDIPNLLVHKDDKTLLSKYPANPISSFYSDKVSVGIIALWTIESIRITELNNNDEPQARFPSLNPILFDKIAISKDQNELQNIAADKYQDWWSSNKSLQDKLAINPLNDTSIEWK